MFTNMQLSGDVIFGSTLEVYVNNQLIYTNAGLPSTTGQPGIGGGFTPYTYWSRFGLLEP